MPFRFRRSVKILPGLRINLSKSGASVSLGGRGFHYTLGPKGTRITAGIPGTGLSWTEYKTHARHSPYARDISSPQPPQSTSAQHCDSLEVIQNASAGQINAFSTSELAPILNRANRRIRLAPAVLVICILLFIAALVQTDQAWVGWTALDAAIFIPTAVLIDRYRRSVKVAFDSAGLTARISEALIVAFNDLMQCKATWIVQAESQTADWKRNAGATSLHRRRKISLRLGKPGCIRGRSKFPFFHIGADELYLLPDAALAVVGGQIASVGYGELAFSNHTVKFIETERVPSDTTIFEHTWRYVNKSGGPDRRFINNRRLPICLYGEVSFWSAGGLNCKLQVSKPTGADSLYKVIEALKQTATELPKSVTYIKSAKYWPAALFIIVFLSFAFVQGLFLQPDALKALADKFSQEQPIVSRNADVPVAPTSKPLTAPPKSMPLDLRPSSRRTEVSARPPLPHEEQTFVGSWSETSCDPGMPDIVITSQRAVSSAAGVCQFSNVRPAGSGWNIDTLCSNSGETWRATINLALAGNTLIWTGRDGTQTQYHRCQ